jgi:DNA repair photolyase
MNEKIQIINDIGKKVEAIAPKIISASRSTDIPAFFSLWLINRIKKGYVVWFNPYNNRPVYISFKRCKVIVFWTKNPKPIIPLLKELDNIGINYYFQYTLNDYEKENFEPNLISLEARIKTFQELSNLIGKDKVIWRFDPIIFTAELNSSQILNRIENIGYHLKGYTEKLIFSFIDINSYRKVKNNLVKSSSMFEKYLIETYEPTLTQIDEFASGISKLRDKWEQEGWRIDLSTCAEDVDLEKYNISHNRCIDGELMKKIFSYDKDLVFYLKYGKFPELNTLFETEIEIKELPSEKLKDKGQRKACGCMISKDIGMYNTCSHLCIYCYANTSRKTVFENMKKINNESESIINMITE